jgi:hypothetical protein
MNGKKDITDLNWRQADFRADLRSYDAAAGSTLARVHQ